MTEELEPEVILAEIEKLREQLKVGAPVWSKKKLEIEAKKEKLTTKFDKDMAKLNVELAKYVRWLGMTDAPEEKPEIEVVAVAGKKKLAMEYLKGLATNAVLTPTGVGKAAGYAGGAPSAFLKSAVRDGYVSQPGGANTPYYRTAKEIS